MRLADVMAHAALSGWAQAGLVVFVTVFAGVLVYTFKGVNRSTFERARHLPLLEDESRKELRDERE